ncbi:MAG: TonB-dependent receptor [Bacteroidales bacterium]|nr:TonB-dependent receptor [Bacteroidales bacterium]
MRAFIIFILLVFPFFSSSLIAQNGFIRGSVFDAVNGETLPGVSIYVEGTTSGTTTDLDGKFNLSIAAGTYDLNISYISYESLVIKDVEVKPESVQLLDDIALKEVSFELAEVVVTAKAVRNTETALFTIKKKSANLLDGISAGNLRKIGDSDAASSMKRVTGVSVDGGKYVYVRGLGDRYTKTILNGVDIPGLDPDRNTIQMDIFPTNIIDNIIVHKSFTADLPADFTGGVIDITTKDFPEEKTSKVSLGMGYNPAMHFNNDYLTYNGGKTDWLGFDDGTRKIPATSNIPLFSEVVGNPNGEKASRYKEILNSFNPSMAAIKQQSYMDFDFGFSIGDQLPKDKVTLGYNFAFSYKNNTEYYKDAEFGRYGLPGDPGIYEMNVREFQLGDYAVNDVLLSGLAGFALKTMNSKYSLSVLHLQNGESKAGIFDYKNSDQGAVFYGIQHNLEYSQRSLSNLIMNGSHSFPARRWDFEWKVSPTYSRIEDPDIRFTRYEDRDGSYSIGTEVGFPERIWRKLEEVNIGTVLHTTKKFDLMGDDARLKFGGAYTYKERDYAIRNFALNIRNLTLTGNPDELFYTENLWPVGGNPGKGTTYEAPFIPNNPNQFNSTVSTAAAYVSTELSFFTKLKATLGVRLENYIQRYTGQDQLGKNVLDNEIVLDQMNLFPAVNLIYSLTNVQNLRASYSQTIARPSFKEMSYAEIYDPITGRTFIGGLFRDANDIAGVEYWNGDLSSTGIHNFDLRWELYAAGGQMFSLSGFYKKFDDPIEMVQFATLTGAFQPRNVGDGEVIGGEAEFRFNLETITPALNGFNVLFNFTYAESRIKLSNTEYESRVENARAGQTIDEYREMSGQAPYIVNSGIAYNGGENGFWENFEAGIYYNVQGPTLLYAGIVDRPDIYSKPFHSLNFNSNKKFGTDSRMQVGLKVENILNQNEESVFQSFEAADRYFTRLNPGIHFKLSFSYSIW